MKKLADACSLLAVIVCAAGQAAAQAQDAGAAAPAEQQRNDGARGGGRTPGSASRSEGSLACQVVEAYLDATREFLDIDGRKELGVEHVLVSDRDDTALAVSSRVNPVDSDSDGQDAGRLVFTLLRVDGKWRIKDIDSQSDDEASAAKKEFKTAQADATALAYGKIAVSTPEPTAFDQHTRRSHQLAQRLRESELGPGAEDASAALRAELRQAITDAFEARQQVQRAELDQLRRRLRHIEQLIESRERIKQEIIRRRVEELLNPALAWDPPRGRPPVDDAAAIPAVGGPSPGAAPPAGAAPRHSDAAKTARARYEMLRRRQELLQQSYLVGNVTINEVLRAAQDKLQAQAALDDSPQAQRRIRRQQVDNLKHLRDVTKTRFAAGDATSDEVLAIKAELLEAQQQLAEQDDAGRQAHAAPPRLEPRATIHWRRFAGLGEVLAVSDKGLVEISLGADDGVRRGMPFIVVAPGSQRHLGRLEVIRVEADRSVARLAEQADLDLPIRRGDQVRSQAVATELAPKEPSQASPGHSGRTP